MNVCVSGREREGKGILLFSKITFIFSATFTFHNEVRFFHQDTTETDIQNHKSKCHNGVGICMYKTT